MKVSALAAFREAVYTPNDTYYAGYQADDNGLINVPAAWGGSRGAGVRVSVLDTGCQLDHPDIGSGSSGKVKVWKNFTSKKTTDASDTNGQGTHTAGTVGARTGNGEGVAAAGFDREQAVGSRGICRKVFKIKRPDYRSGQLERDLNFLMVS